MRALILVFSLFVFVQVAMSGLAATPMYSQYPIAGALPFDAYAKAQEQQTPIEPNPGDGEGQPPVNPDPHPGLPPYCSPVEKDEKKHCECTTIMDPDNPLMCKEGKMVNENRHCKSWCDKSRCRCCKS